MQAANTLVLIFFFLVSSGWIGLQGPFAFALSPNEQIQSYNFQDSLRRDTPLGSYLAFVAACDRRDFETAARYLDLRFLQTGNRAQEGPELARKLKFILDRTVFLDDLNLSADPRGLVDDGLPSTRDRLGSILTPKGVQVPIYMDRLWENQIQIWKFSQATLAQIPDLYEEYGHGRLDELLPAVLLDLNFLHLQLWQWLFLIFFVPLGFLISKILILMVCKILARTLPHILELKEDDIYRQFGGPSILLLSTVMYLVALYQLNLTLAAREVLQLTLTTMFFLGLTWMSLRLIDLFSSRFQHKLRQRGLYSLNSVIPLGRRFAKIFLFILTVLGLLQTYQVNITALLAGLGVGGIAVALAAQKSLENLFGGVALIIDQPVRVGDFCEFDGQLGNVEDIGLRSTRIRTIDRGLLTIPNREFSQMKLKNLSKRDSMTLNCKISLRYETNPDQLRFILMELRKILYSHPKVIDDERVRVRFLGFQDYAVNVDFFAHVRTQQWYEFLAIQEDIYLRVLEMIKQSGSDFALPSRTVYSENGAGMNQERSQDLAAAIEQLRAEQRLPFPNFSREEVLGFQNSIDYPPKPSSGQKSPT